MNSVRGIAEKLNDMFMKTKLFCLLGCMLLALGFISCSSDDDEELNNDLVGCWLLIGDEGWEKEDGEIVDEWDEPDSDNIYIYFYENGTGAQREYGYDWQFTWSVNSNKLTITAYGTTGTGTIKTLNSTTLVVESQEKYTTDGVAYESYSKETYRRVEE
jgi:hypothetical protein